MAELLSNALYTKETVGILSTVGMVTGMVAFLVVGGSIVLERYEVYWMLCCTCDECHFLCVVVFKEVWCLRWCGV